MFLIIESDYPVIKAIIDKKSIEMKTARSFVYIGLMLIIKTMSENGYDDDKIRQILKNMLNDQLSLN